MEGLPDASQGRRSLPYTLDARLPPKLQVPNCQQVLIVLDSRIRNLDSQEFQRVTEMISFFYILHNLLFMFL